MYRVQRATNIHAWLDDESHWNAFAGTSPFQQWAWQATWWKHFGRSLVPYFLEVIGPNKRLCALVPWTLSNSRRRVLQFVASGEVCSDGLSIHCQPEHALGVGRAVADWLVDQTHDDSNGWHELDLDGVFQGDAAIAALIGQLSRRGVWCQPETRDNRWFLATTQNLETYLSEFGKTRRRQFRQHLERFRSAEDLSCSEPKDALELHSALEELIELHQKRWNAIGQPGSYANPIMRGFIHEASELFLLRNQLRFVSLKQAGTSIASQLQFASGDGTLAIYSSGMSLEHTELEPGRLLDANTIAHAFEMKLPGIDYLRGDEPYKANLHAQPTPLVQIKAFSKRRFNRLERAVYRTTFEAKQWVRRRQGKALVQVLKELQPVPSADREATTLGNVSLTLPTDASKPNTTAE